MFFLRKGTGLYLGDLLKYLITRNLSDTSIHTNKIHVNLNNANPLKKIICRFLISTIQKQTKNKKNEY